MEPKDWLCFLLMTRRTSNLDFLYNIHYYSISTHSYAVILTCQCPDSTQNALGSALSMPEFLLISQTIIQVSTLLNKLCITF